VGDAFLARPADLELHREFVHLRSRLVVEAMNRMGYDLYGVGAGDLPLGPALLRELREGSRFTWLAANLNAPGGEAWGDAATVLRRGDLAIGFFGLVSADAARAIGGAGHGFTVTDPVEAARRTTGVLRALGAHTTVLLADLSSAEMDRLLASGAAPDLVLGGAFPPAATGLEQVGRTFQARAGHRGMYLGLVSFPHAAAAAGIAGETPPRWDLLPLDDLWPDDPGQAALVEEFHRRSMTLPQSAAAGGGTGAPVTFVGAARCRECHPEITGEWSTTSHAQAYRVLEERKRTFTPDCLRCHTTGFDEPGGYTGFGSTPHLKGVQCEACHGPGGSHRGRGDILRAVGPERCRRCHDQVNSPTFDYWAYREQLGGHVAPPAPGRRTP
jgi:predicted CXXCH cytochrome family protein